MQAFEASTGERAALAVEESPRGRVPHGLSAAEERVLGCLLEKQATTPDVYPLSLNSLRLACNQTTNREPVVSYEEATVREAAQRLGRRGLARLASGSASRAVKYRHLLADALPLGDGERALLCVLLLRGAQTPGELKQRSERIHAFADLAAVHGALAAMQERGLVSPLPRRPGQKEERYRQLLGAEGDDATPESPRGDLAERVAVLEAEVARLRELLAERGSER